MAVDATLTTQTVTRAGVAQTLVAAAGGGDSFTPGAGAYFHIFNGGGSSITVTFITPGALISDVGLADSGGSVPAGAERLFGPFPRDYFADPTDGLVHVIYSAVTSVTVAAFTLTPN
jgi:hypothetical protein